MGRKKIIDKLKSWLASNHKGSYLVTGYRGMGKTSFVGKVISNLIASRRGRKRTQFFRTAFVLLNYSLIAVFFFLWTAELFIGGLSKWVWGIALANLVLMAARWVVRWPGKGAQRQHIHHINLKIASSVDNERDIIALIADSIRVKFKEYKSNQYPHRKTVILFRFLSAVAIPYLAFRLHELCFVHISTVNVFRGADASFLDRVIIFLADTINSLGFGLRVVFIFAIAFFLFRLVSRLLRYLLRKVGLERFFVTAREMLDQLERCCDRIDSSVAEENEPHAGIDISIASIGRRRKKSKNYQQASVREIEQELIRITEQFSKSIFIRSKLIIVLDELDKFTVKSNGDNERTSRLPEFTYDSGFPGSNTSRAKKQNVFYLLAQLKFFISNANAKFIFVSGRELYDAYLSDVSDREFSVNSIFNGIINVESFFSPGPQSKDVLLMTEQYLCKKLLKKTDIKEYLIHKKKKNRYQIKRMDTERLYTLKTYYYHMSQKIDRKFSNKPEKRDELRNELERTIVFLKQFITNLAFLSNGAPKKLSMHFENYVVSPSMELKVDVNRNNSDKYFSLHRELGIESEYYLCFGYYDQQQIGFLHYMTYPVFQTIISPASEYGDKFLVSASFLVGHIFRQHCGGFSLRNLEYLPELIESNKTPEMRYFINLMISYLCQFYLVRIPIGLYQYKVPLKLYEETSIFSKKSEQISAVFNFSRDDSRAVKQYFSDMIEYHSKDTKEHRSDVLANLHFYLGDQYLASEEYTEAINQYRTAKRLTYSEYEASKDKNAPLVARLVLIMLKLGMAYEKRNTMDSAYLVYCEIVNLLVANRYIDEDKYQLEFRLQKYDGSWTCNRVLLFEKQNVVQANPVENPEFHRFTHPRFINEEEKNGIKYWTYDDELIANLGYHLTPDKSALISRLSIFDDLGTIYLPLLAKLYAIEKQNICGITRNNIAVTESEFRYLYLSTNHNEKYLIAVDFFRKLGDILYYKNSDFGTDAGLLMNLMECWGYDIKMDIFEYCYSTSKLKKDTEEITEWISKLTLDDIDFQNINSREELVGKIKEVAATQGDNIGTTVSEFFKSEFFRIPTSAINNFETRKECWENIKRRSTAQRTQVPCYACKYYNRSLTMLAERLLTHEEQEQRLVHRTKALRFLIAIRNGKISLRENDMIQVALTMDSMGNLQVCCADKESRIRNEFLDAVSSFYSNENNGEVFDELGRLGPLEKAVTLHLSAIEYYKRTSNYRSAILCYTKIFNLFTTCIRANSVSPDAVFMNMMYDIFLSDAIRCAYYDRDFSTLTEWTDLKPSEHSSNLIRFENMPIMPDIEEVLLAYYEIVLELNKPGPPILPEREDDLRAIYRSNSLNCLRLESSTCARNVSMLFKANLNKRILDHIVSRCGEGSHATAFPKIAREEVEYSLSDRILDALFDGSGQTSYKKAVEFLISDSIFCLSNMIQFFTTTQRSTLYSNSFIAGIYEKLLKWVDIKDAYYAVLEDENMKKAFEKYFYDRVDESSRNVLKCTYLREMATRYYEKAVEMNSEGPAYQDFIGGMFITDDDLQNDTCHFYLALERYVLKMQHRDSSDDNHKKRCYDGASYFKEPKS